MNTVWSWSVIGLFYQCGIGCTVGFGAEVSVMWYGCLVWVVLCGAGTLLVSILGPAWRQSRTLGGRGRSATKSEDEEEDGQVIKFQIFEEKEIILLSPFCKSVRPVCAPISHFPK